MNTKKMVILVLTGMLLFLSLGMAQAEDKVKTDCGPDSMFADPCAASTDASKSNANQMRSLPKVQPSSRLPFIKRVSPDATDPASSSGDPQTGAANKINAAKNPSSKVFFNPKEIKIKGSVKWKSGIGSKEEESKSKHGVGLPKPIPIPILKRIDGARPSSNLNKKIVVPSKRKKDQLGTTGPLDRSINFKKSMDSAQPILSQ